MQPRSRKRDDPNPWDRLKQGAAMGDADPWDRLKNSPCEEPEPEVASSSTSIKSGEAEPELDEEKKKEEKSHQGAGLVKSTTSGCSIQ